MCKPLNAANRRYVITIAGCSDVSACLASSNEEAGITGNPARSRASVKRRKRTPLVSTSKIRPVCVDWASEIVFISRQVLAAEDFFLPDYVQVAEVRAANRRPSAPSADLDQPAQTLELTTFPGSCSSWACFITAHARLPDARNIRMSRAIRNNFVTSLKRASRQAGGDQRLVKSNGRRVGSQPNFASPTTPAVVARREARFRR